MTKYVEGDVVYTELGQAKVFEQVGDTVYVDLDNGVEADFDVSQVSDEPIETRKTRNTESYDEMVARARLYAQWEATKTASRINTVIKMRSHEGFE